MFCRTNAWQNISKKSDAMDKFMQAKHIKKSDEMDKYRHFYGILKIHKKYQTRF